MSRAARLIAAVLILSGSAVALAAISTEPAKRSDAVSVQLSRATQRVEIRNSKAGRAVVAGANLAPGDRRRGTVVVGVTSPARMSVRANRLATQPGPNGGVLAEALSVRITMIGGGRGRHRTVYHGPLTGVGVRHLGRWHPGERHRFRVRVGLPKSQTDQNAFQASATGFRLVWRAR